MNTEYTQFVATLLKRLAKLNYIKPGEVRKLSRKIQDEWLKKGIFQLYIKQYQRF